MFLQLSCKQHRPTLTEVYPGPGGFTVSLVVMVAVSVAAAVVAATVPLTPRKAGP